MIDVSEAVERRLRTAVVYLGIFALGMCTAIPGPTLLELEKLVKAETYNLTTIYLARSSGYLIGSFIGGITLEKCKKKQLQIFLFTFVMALSTTAIPFCRTLTILISLMAVSGMAMGALDTGVNVWCLTVWRDESNPYFQALHFFFGVGASVAPSIAGIFLPHENLSKNETLGIESSMAWNSTNNGELPPVTYAYLCIGVISLIVSLLFAGLFLVKITDKKFEETSFKDPPLRLRIPFLVVTFILIGVYCGLEIGFGQMIATYAVTSNHKFSESAASYITSLFWGTFTIFRGFSIYLSMKFMPHTLLFVDVILMIFASSILVAFGNTVVSCLWFGCGLLGLSLASFYASSITWVKIHVNVNNMVGSSFIVAASLGEMIAPLTISQYVKKFPQVLMFIILGCSIACGFLILVMWILTSQMPDKLQFPSDSKESHQSDKDASNDLGEEASPLNSIRQIDDTNL